MQSLKERILKEVEGVPHAPYSPFHGFAEGFGDGQECENARLRPLIEALADAVDDFKTVASGSKCSACSCSCHKHASDALTKLDERLKEME